MPGMVYGCDSWQAWKTEVWYDNSGSVKTYCLESLPQVNFKVSNSQWLLTIAYSLLWIGINQIIAILKNLKKFKIYFYVRI